MNWTVDYSETAKDQLKKLDKKTAKRILDYMDERVIGSGDPRSAGKGLTGPLGGLWRYRTGDFRVICEIQDNLMQVLTLNIGDRKDVYKDKH